MTLNIRFTTGKHPIYYGGDVLHISDLLRRNIRFTTELVNAIYPIYYGETSGLLRNW